MLRSAGYEPFFKHDELPCLKTRHQSAVLC